MSIKITEHALQRAKERFGICEKDLSRMAENCLSDGLSHEETYGSLRAYLDNIKGKRAVKIIYKYIVFVYSVTRAGDFILKTVVPLKGRYKNQADMLTNILKTN